MESVAIAEPVRSGPSLTNLPRETRNQIYRYLLVSSKPIKVCYNHEFSRLYLRAGRHNEDVSIEFLCYAVKGSELAQEAYEEFFRNNIFDCGSYSGCEDLQRNLIPNTANHGYLNFEKNPWIRKVKISFFNDFQRKPSEHLAHLLRFPNLQQVEITIFGFPEDRGETNSVDWLIESIAKVCKSIRGKVGGGLLVKVKKYWGEPRSTTNGLSWKEREPENVSWMWEKPSNETRGRVRKGVGTHKEEIQMLMSTGWGERKGKLGAWAEHWRQEHIEQQRLRELQLRQLPDKA